MVSEKKGCTFGIDIGGTDIKGVVLSSDDQPKNVLLCPSDASLGPVALKNRVVEMVESLIALGEQPLAIGIGCAGGVDSEKGIVRNSPNFSNWNNVEIRSWVTTHINLPVSIDNDANCAALAEFKMGGGRGKRNVVVLTFGTGIGGGLILDRKLYRGSTGTGGELGHFSIRHDGDKCNCGHTGCFERYCSGSAVSRLNNGTNPKDVFLPTNEQQYRVFISSYLSDLAKGITSLGNLFDPDVILLGGGVAKGFQRFLPEIRKMVRKSVFPAVAENMKIELCELDNSAGAIGAAYSAREKIA